MKPLWLVETGVWHDGNVDRLLALLREQGVAVHAEQYTHLGGMEFEVADFDRPVVFYGSLNTAEFLRSRIDAVPLIWYDRHAFSCRSYYARWGRFLLQEHYAFYPLAELPTCDTATPAASTPASRLAGVPVQEAQSLLIELSCALVNRSMCASLEH